MISIAKNGEKKKKFVKIGRNDPCWCGSGKKYKQCHEAFDRKIERIKLMGHEVPTRDMIKTPEQIEKIKKSAVINMACLEIGRASCRERV